MPDQWLDQRRVEVLLAEYGKAQDSAQFHDGLVWSVTSVFWGASFILLGVIMNGSAHAQAIWLAAGGITLHLVVLVFVLQFHNIKRQKYARCRQIEEILDMEQHRNFSRHPRRTQQALYILITLCFVGAWAVVAYRGAREVVGSRSTTSQEGHPAVAAPVPAEPSNAPTQSGAPPVEIKSGPTPGGEPTPQPAEH